MWSYFRSHRFWRRLVVSVIVTIGFVFVLLGLVVSAFIALLPEGFCYNFVMFVSSLIPLHVVLGSYSLNLFANRIGVLD